MNLDKGCIQLIYADIYFHYKAYLLNILFVIEMILLTVKKVEDIIIPVEVEEQQECQSGSKMTSIV